LKRGQKRGQANRFNIEVHGSAILFSRHLNFLLSQTHNSFCFRFSMVAGLCSGVARASPVDQAPLFATKGLEEFLTERFAAEIPAPLKGRLQAQAVRKFISCHPGIVPVHATFDPFEVAATPRHCVRILEFGKTPLYCHPRRSLRVSTNRSRSRSSNTMSPRRFPRAMAW